MKFVRPLLIILGVLALVCGIAAGLALTPSIQRWAVLRATAGTPGLQLTVTEFSAGLSHLSVRGVAMQRTGLNVTLDRLEADYSLIEVLASRRLHLRQLTADGLVVDASRLSPVRAQAAAAGAPAVAPGLLAQLQLPVELVLDDVRLAGRALLPGVPGQTAVAADFKVTGSGFAPGQEGALLLTATLKNPVADARVAALNAQVNLRATQTTARTFSRVALTAVVDAEGRGLPEQSQLKISAALGHDATGENYAVSIDTQLRGQAENMLTVHAALPAGQKEYSGQWTLRARHAQLEPFFLGGALPDFDAHGEGRFSFAPATAALGLQGRLEAGVSRLEVLEPAWRAIGAVRLQAQFDVAAAAGVARLNQLGLSLAGAAPVLELTATGAAEFNWANRRLQVGGASAGEVVHLKLLGLPLAWVRPFVGAADISGGMITGEFAVLAEKDRLVARAVAPLRIDSLSVVQRGQLLVAKAALSLNAEAVLTEKEVSARVTDFTVKTPAGDSLAAQAAVTMPLAAGPPITVTASYRADLPTLLTPWLPLGRIKAVGEADFTFSAAKVALRRLSMNVTDAAGLALFKAAALRPFALDLAARRAVTDGKGAVDLLSIAVGRVPLDRLPLNQLGAKLGGVVEQGEFVLSAEGDRLTLRAAAPVKLADVSLAQDGRPALTGLAVELQPSFELMNRASAKAQTGDVTLRTADGATLLTFKGEATRTPEAGLRGSLTFNLEVPALSSQPLFAGAEAVSAGRASGEIRAALAATGSQLEARMTLNGLVARDDGQTLPVANLSFRAVAADNGRIAVQAPLLLDRAGQRSDLNFALELTPAGRNFAVDGKLTGEHIELADALSVLGVFMASAASVDARPAAVAVESEIIADTAPAWARFNGQFVLDVKSVTRGADWAMTGLTGLVTIDPAKLALQKLAATFSEKSQFAAKGEVQFTGGAQPYALGGDFSLTDFDAGKFFKALEPAKPATVEGIFSATGKFTGEGETLPRTLARARGSFELTSRAGIFRGLQRTTSKFSMTSKAVELGASVLGSILGSAKATKAAEKVAGAAYFVDQLAQALGELNYDQLNVRLVRAATLNMTLEDFSLVSPDIRLLGKGTVTYVADKPLLEQPLSVSLTLAGRGKLEQLLGKLRLTDGSRDELGYARTIQPVTVGGSLAKPDPSAYFTRLATSKLSDLFAPEN
ncbi:MAG: AsmA-like C-terminal region-containing protein [Lacunisphaera sp.]|nr:AsmA-like C-terminal region-containing protein [Lacunisphaera sp.]